MGTSRENDASRATTAEQVERLQELVCYLLAKNQQLRERIANLESEMIALQFVEFSLTSEVDNQTPSSQSHNALHDND